MTLIATLAVAALATAISPKVYRSTAILQVGQGAVPRTGNESTLTQQQTSQGLTRQYATLLTSRSFLERLRGRIGLSTDELQQRLSATAVPETGLIELTMEADSTAEASRLAAAAAAGFIATLRADAERQSETLQTQVQDRINALSVRLRALGTSGSAAVEAQRASLRSAQNALTEQLASAVAQNITQSVSLAAPPAGEDDPASPRPLLNLVAGLVLGLLLGVGLAYLRSRIEPVVTSAEEAERVAIRVPVLASIPLQRSYSPQDAVLTEAYEMLRSNLVFRFSESDRVITVASYRSGEGKTSVVQGLAAAARRSGKSLLVIDGDLRTRDLSSRLGHARSPGLSTVLAGRDSLRGSIVEVAPGLSLLPAGPRSQNAPALFGDDSMRELIDSLRDRYQLIVIDSPPSANLADAGILASLSDAVILVVRAGRTKRDDLLAAVVHLSNTRTPVSGLVVLEPVRSVDRQYFAPTSASPGDAAKAPVSHAG